MGGGLLQILGRRCAVKDNNRIFFKVYSNNSVFKECEHYRKKKENLLDKVREGFDREKDE